MRLAEIKKAPISWQGLDKLTAAERFLDDAIDWPIDTLLAPCFRSIDAGLGALIRQVWSYLSVALHLSMQKKKVQDDEYKLCDEVASLYETEAHRILGSIFPLEHHFWKEFYIHQSQDYDKPLVAIDAIQCSTKYNSHVNYQLLVLAIGALIRGTYAEEGAAIKYYRKAQGLLVHHHFPELKDWINYKITEIH